MVLALAVTTAACAQAPADGLRLPDTQASASLQAALAELDRSASTVVAEVGTRKITWGDLADRIREMPLVVAGLPFPVLYQRAALEAMQQTALALRGQSAGLDKDPVVQRRIHAAVDRAVANEVLHRSLAPNLTDQALRATYDAVVANQPAPEEVRGRIIMVGSRDEATSLIRRLQGGADFLSLARDFSKDGTAAEGGDLGYVRLDLLEPEIGAVMFALAPGQTSAFPVRSHNAWFIVRVEARRQPAAPSFEAARGALEQDIIHAGQPQLMSEALNAVPVTYHGLTGKTATTDTSRR